MLRNDQMQWAILAPGTPSVIQSRLEEFFSRMDHWEAEDRVFQLKPGTGNYHLAYGYCERQSGIQDPLGAWLSSQIAGRVYAAANDWNHDGPEFIDIYENGTSVDDFETAETGYLELARSLGCTFPEDTKAELPKRDMLELIVVEGFAEAKLRAVLSRWDEYKSVKMSRTSTDAILVHWRGGHDSPLDPLSFGLPEAQLFSVRRDFRTGYFGASVVKDGVDKARLQVHPDSSPEIGAMGPINSHPGGHMDADTRRIRRKGLVSGWMRCEY